MRSVKEASDFTWRHNDMGGNRDGVATMSPTGCYSGPGKNSRTSSENVLACVSPISQIGKPSRKPQESNPDPRVKVGEKSQETGWVRDIHFSWVWRHIACNPSLGGLRLKDGSLGPT